MMKYIMAIDDGTTGIRSIIFDHDAKIISQSYEEVNQVFPKPNYTEQSAVEVWEKCQQVMRQSLEKGKIKPEQIEAIGLTTQRSTNLCWDKKTGKPIYNAITWQDTRAADICSKMDQNNKMRFIRGLGKTTKSLSKVFKKIRYTKTGARLVTSASFSFSPVSSLAHTKWLFENIPKIKELHKKGNLLCGTMDTWLIWNLTDKKVFATDFSNASSTGMYDSFKLQWSDLFFDVFDLPKDILPEVLDTNGDYGSIDKNIIGKEIPICSNIADQQSALFADGCFKPGEVKCTNGTGTFIDMNVGDASPASLHKLLPLISWSIKGKITYMLEGMINTTGSAMQWLKNNLKIIEKVEDSEKLASNVVDTSGVYFVPAFTGLSSPYWDPRASGIVIGLSRNTRKEHIVRAALEGIVYRCKDVINTMEIDSNLKIRNIKADGGASKNNFLLQFMADMIDISVERPKNLDSTALGAAFLAGLSTGYWNSKEEILKIRSYDKVFKSSYKEEKRELLYKGWKRAIERASMWRV